MRTWIYSPPRPAPSGNPAPSSAVRPRRSPPPPRPLAAASHWLFWSPYFAIFSLGAFAVCLFRCKPPQSDPRIAPKSGSGPLPTHALQVLQQRHKPIIHMELIVAVEVGGPRVVGQQPHRDLLPGGAKDYVFIYPSKGGIPI